VSRCLVSQKAPLCLSGTRNLSLLLGRPGLHGERWQQQVLPGMCYCLSSDCVTAGNHTRSSTMSNTAIQKKVGRQVAFSGAAPTLAPRAQRSAVLGSAGRKLVLQTANITAALWLSCTVLPNYRQQAKFIAGDFRTGEQHDTWAPWLSHSARCLQRSV
jgi:hypothetical protein